MGKTKTISEQDRQIRYWAHMLDECLLDEVEIQSFQQPNPNHKLPSMTASEIREMKNMYGITDNFQDSGWILLDGDMLQMHRTEEVEMDNDGNCYDWHTKKPIERQRWEHDIVFPEKYIKRCGFTGWGADLLDPVRILTLGWIRISFAETVAHMTILAKPTQAQMNRLYELLDIDFSGLRNYYKHTLGIFKFELELPGKFIKYEDEREFKMRFLNDIRNAF